MDIAKIRKKLQEKKSQEEPGQAPPAPEISREGKDAPEEEVRDVQEPVHVPVIQPPELPAKTTGQAQPEVRNAGPEVRTEGGEEETLEILTFSLGREEFAFRVPDVEEIVRFQKITRVPTLPRYVLGITSLRGKIIPVLDLKARLGITRDRQEVSSSDLLEQAESGTEQKILIVSGSRGMIGAIIDRVLGVIRIAGREILDPPAHLSEMELKYIEGVVIAEKRFISIIHAEDTLSIETS